MKRLITIGVLLMIGLCSGSKPDGHYNVSELTGFPKGFIFGTATASYQVEGAWNVSGKGENIWDRITHTNPDFVKNRDNGDVACDSYHLYKEDVKNIKKIGFKMYRFSLSWSRLFPTGNASKVNQDGVNYYNNLTNELLANGIMPMISIFHWDLPQPLEDIGGWLNPIMADIFAEYARAVFKLFGDRVKWWATINEPMSIAYGYGTAERAPALADKHGYGEYQAAHNLLRAHGKAYRIYEREFKKEQKGKVSVVLCGAYYFPANESNSEDVKAAERANMFNFGWFGNPVFSKDGDYPAVMREYVDRHSKDQRLEKSRLPSFTKEEINEIQGSYDYLALNHYGSAAVRNGLSNDLPNPSFDHDKEVIISQIAEATPTECSWFQYFPEGMRAVLNWVKKEYNDPEIFITENGYCDKDQINDQERITFFREYLKSILAAIKEDKCKITGYTVWSLMDNFEWRDGYTKRFGLLRVDFNSTERTRTMKESAKFMQQLIKENTSSGIRISPFILIEIISLFSLFVYNVRF